MLSEKSIAGKAVVIGAGTMGGGIAAQLANSGWDVALLDIDNQVAGQGLSRINTARPPLLYVPGFAAHIRVGNTGDNLDWLGDADWIVEAVAEKMDVKRSILALIDTHAGPNAVISSNTSGLSLREMADGRSQGLKRRFLGTHFCNPPRYLKLLELIPLIETGKGIAAGFAGFAEMVLGQRVVFAHDTPGFISTRIGIWHLLDCIRTAAGQGLTPEEADYLTGPLIGRPRTATFRLADLVGFDILSDIGRNQYSQLLSDPFRDGWLLPDVLSRLLAEGRTGDKGGAGFYKRSLEPPSERRTLNSVKTVGGETLVLDIATLQYRRPREVKIDAVEAMYDLPLPERIKAIRVERRETWGRFLNTVLDRLDEYVRTIAPEIADSPADIDNVMRWGFNWEMPPCRMADLRRDSVASAPSYFSDAGAERRCRDFATNQMRPLPADPLHISLFDLKQAGKTITEIGEASLIDLGDGVLCLEFHTKMNTLGPALSAFIEKAREIAERDFRVLVIGNQAPHFSAGFDLNLFLDAIRAKKWSVLDKLLKGLQDAAMGLKYSPIPIVSAPRGYTLGGGAEVALQCAEIQAAPELYMGLPEVLAGVIPAGGGIKEMLARAMEGWDGVADPFPRVEEVFGVISAAHRSTSAQDARRLGFLRPADGISPNADLQLYQAKERALRMAESGYRPPERKGIWVMGADGLARLRMAIHWQYRAGAITEHDRLIFDSLAQVLCGGELPYSQEVSEEELLALEREIFMRLAREPKSQERMKHVLETGKPLKN